MNKTCNLYREMDCPCGSSTKYSNCCYKLHKGALSPSPLALMRARYSAYALNIPDYIIKTTHPASPHYELQTAAWQNTIIAFHKTTQFRGLQILESTAKDLFGVVTFVAYLEQNNQDASFTERSYFEKFHGRWLYRTGIVAKGHVTNLTLKKPLSLIPIAYYGAAVLRQPASFVSSVTCKIRLAITHMVATIDALQLPGLAAAQVFLPLRLFIIREKIPTPKMGKTSTGDRVFINLEIVESSKETWSAVETCVSIPAVQVAVTRPTQITINYTDINGKTRKESVSGLDARTILQHYDYTKGILITDYLGKNERKKFQSWLDALQNKTA